MNNNLLGFKRNHSWLPKKLRPEQTLFFNEVFYRTCSGMQLMCHAPSFSTVYLLMQEVRLGTGLESRSSSIFYPLTPKSRLTLPLGRFPHTNVHKKLRSRDTVQPPLLRYVCLSQQNMVPMVAIMAFNFSTCSYY